MGMNFAPVQHYQQRDGVVIATAYACAEHAAAVAAELEALTVPLLRQGPDAVPTSTVGYPDSVTAKEVSSVDG